MPPRFSPSSLAALALLAVLAPVVACTDDGGAARPAGVSTTSVPPTTGTTAPPTTTTTALDLELAGALPATADCPAVPAMARPAEQRPRYRLSVDVRPDEGVVRGWLHVRFTPDVATDRLVFRLWPNGPRGAAAGARLEPGPVEVDGRPVETQRPYDTTLVVPLARQLADGDEVEAAMPWTLTLPGPSADRIATHGDAIRLGSFFPILAWEPGVGWATDAPTGGFAEASTAPTADFDLTVAVPEGLGVLASGVQTAPGRWHAPAMRDVALSVGRFRVAQAMAHAPGPVAVTVGVHDGVDADPTAYLDRVVRSLESFHHRFGPYPWRTFTLGITPGLGGGIEYPGHVMQGPGTLGRTTSHEVGHQWFYGLVGNNQGRDPWLDEGLATWAEAGFEDTLGVLRNRSLPSYARGHAGEPMTYWERRLDGYYRGVYVQPTQALATLGAPATVDCALRHYVAANAFGVARPADLVEAMQVVFPDAAAALARIGVFP